MRMEVPGVRETLRRLIAVTAAAMALCWPAFLNRYVILYPDSLSYLYSGHFILRQLAGRQTPIWQYSSDRSEFYAAGLCLLHWGPSFALLVAINALLTAWVLWLLVRCVLAQGRKLAVYLAMMATLISLTTVGWYVSVILPDILGPVLYVAIYLLVFQAKTLRRWEEICLAIVACWAIVSHATHFLVAAGLCVLLGSLWLARWSAMKGRGVRVGLVTAMLLVCGMAQMAVHHRLYGKATLLGQPPAFLMARLLGDGPARLYLQQNCSHLHWEICTHVQNLPTTENEFLWPEKGIWRASSWAQRDALRREQTPLALATLRAYPLQQIAISWHNFVSMLFIIGPKDFGDVPMYARAGLNSLIPGMGDRYRGTLQSKDALPQLFFQQMERVVLPVSMLIATLALPWLWRIRQEAMLGLSVTVIFVLLANAFLGGVISAQDPRLQDRVSWLITMVAVLDVVCWWKRRNVQA